MASTEQPLVDARAVLRSLAGRRRVFHSEADFQFAFAWEVQLQRSELEVRLETHPEPAVRLDLELIGPARDRGIAVELKYMTRLWRGTDRGETFSLKNHGASDVRGYDVIKDIHRVERFTSARPGWAGLVIALTNDAGYWRPRTQQQATNADAFRLGEGTVLGGSRAWGPKTGGTSRGREASLELRGSYPLTWIDYSALGPGPAETFRALVVEIGSLHDHH